MSDLWIPGATGPVDQFVDRLRRQIAQVAEDAYVEVVLADGARFAVESISADPGFGFVTLRPHVDDDRATPAALVVPLAAIRRIEIDRMDASKPAFGFAPSAE
jgi:hypothetical protein